MTHQPTKMKKSIITYGLMAGIVISMLMLYNVNSASYREGNFDFDRSLMIGYASMLIGFSFVYIGIRKYRDKYREGIITFRRAFKTGSIMVLIASTIYVAAWLVDYFYFIPDFLKKNSAHMLDGLRATGASPVEIDQQAKEMAPFAPMYKNPFFNAMMTYIQILPVGLVITLISSFILKRKMRKFIHSIVTYKVASTFSQLLEGWFTVYKQYLSVSFISANKVSLFTFPHYIGNRSALILGRDHGKTVCTISAVLDGENGLPLDVYFKNDLDNLRR